MSPLRFESLGVVDLDIALVVVGDMVQLGTALQERSAAEQQANGRQGLASSLSLLRLFCLGKYARPEGDEVRQTAEHRRACRGHKVCESERGEFSLPTLRHVVELRDMRFSPRTMPAVTLYDLRDRRIA